MDHIGDPLPPHKRRNPLSRSGRQKRLSSQDYDTPTSHPMEVRDQATSLAVTTPDASRPTSAGLTALPLPTSPTAHGDYARPSPGDVYASYSNTDEEVTTESAHRRFRKSIKGSNSAKSSKKSPNSLLKKTRERVKSITSLPSSSPSSHASPTATVQPSPVTLSNPFNMTEVRQTLPYLPRRTTSAETTPTLGNASNRSSSTIASDSARVLQLMKTTCGRMHGILFYRPIGEQSWQSGYCAINVASGSLVCQVQGDVSHAQTLISDLRGCRVYTHSDQDSNGKYLHVVLPTNGSGCQLRPPVQETFDSWLAALLCWQPQTARSLASSLIETESAQPPERRPLAHRRTSDLTAIKSVVAIKVGQNFAWLGPLPPGSARLSIVLPTTEETAATSGWSRVNCSVLENSTFKLTLADSVTPIFSIKLCHLPRRAIQRLDCSIFNLKFCVAIHPQTAYSTSRQAGPSSLYVYFECRKAFESWFSLLRTMTIPEFYGPDDSALPAAMRESSHSPQEPQRMFRIERSLNVVVSQCKFAEAFSPSQSQKSLPRRVYADILVDKELKARTSTKLCTRSTLWSEEVNILDIPDAISAVDIVVRQDLPGASEWTMSTEQEHDLINSPHSSAAQDLEIAAHDPLCGYVRINAREMEQERLAEGWRPLIGESDLVVGQILVRCNLREQVVLVSSEYEQLAKLIRNFNSGLTAQIAHALNQDLKKLSDVLLDFYQASGCVDDWLTYLIEDEVDGIYKEAPPARLRFSGRLHSNDSYESNEQREVFVRDLSRSATTEANLLFRGNSLVTKALDTHMQRVGQEYLEKTIGPIIRRALAQDLDCEVDPNRVPSRVQLEQNWANLTRTTAVIWAAISTSAEQCPVGMRRIMKHIRSCSEDRLGVFIRTVKYTSVSGFLFLRFFCPAILNPRLFGLIDSQPSERTRRTFTLIAKSLNNLANMATFGQKEPWMEPMNRFINNASAEFKIFVDQICSLDAIDEMYHEPQYRATLQVQARLSTTSREGLHTLPFLLDPCRSMATLMDMWLHNTPRRSLGPESSNELRQFHRLCQELDQKGKDYLAHAQTTREASPSSKPRVRDAVTSMSSRSGMASSLPSRARNLTRASIPNFNSPTSARSSPPLSSPIDFDHRKAFRDNSPQRADSSHSTGALSDGADGRETQRRVRDRDGQVFLSASRSERRVEKIEDNKTPRQVRRK